MSKEKFHYLLCKYLAALKDDLNCYEQTTHATLFTPTMTNITNVINSSYNDPSAYNISTLVQLIEGFIKTGLSK